MDFFDDYDFGAQSATKQGTNPVGPFAVRLFSKMVEPAPMWIIRLTDVANEASVRFAQPIDIERLGIHGEDSIYRPNSTV